MLWALTPVVAKIAKAIETASTRRITQYTAYPPARSPEPYTQVVPCYPQANHICGPRAALIVKTNQPLLIVCALIATPDPRCPGDHGGERGIGSRVPDARRKPGPHVALLGIVPINQRAGDALLRIRSAAWRGDRRQRSDGSRASTMVGPGDVIVHATCDDTHASPSFGANGTRTNARPADAQGGALVACPSSIALRCTAARSPVRCRGWRKRNRCVTFKMD